MVFLNLERILGCYFMEKKEKEKLKILKREIEDIEKRKKTLDG